MIRRGEDRSGRVCVGGQSHLLRKEALIGMEKGGGGSQIYCRERGGGVLGALK